MARQMKINLSFRGEEAELYERLKALDDTGEFIKRAALAMLENGKGQEDPVTSRLDLILAELKHLKANGVVVSAGVETDDETEEIDQILSRALGG